MRWDLVESWRRVVTISTSAYEFRTSSWTRLRKRRLTVPRAMSGGSRLGRAGVKGVPPVERGGSADAGVEGVAEAVAEKADGEDERRDDEAREHRDPRVGEEIVAAVPDHPAPRRCRRQDAEAEEPERGLGEEDAGRAVRPEYEDERHDVGQDVARRDAQLIRADGPRRLDEVAAAELEHGGPDEPGEGRPLGQREHEHEVQQARAGDREDRDGEEDDGERELDVDEARDDRVDPAAEQSRRDARDDADEHREERRGDGHEHRVAGGEDDP